MVSIKKTIGIIFLIIILIGIIYALNSIFDPLAPSIEQQIPRFNTCVFTGNVNDLNAPDIPVENECTYQKAEVDSVMFDDFTSTGGIQVWRVEGDQVRCIITSGFQELGGERSALDTIRSLIQGVSLRDIQTDVHVSCFDRISFGLDEWVVIENTPETITFRLK